MILLSLAGVACLAFVCARAAIEWREWVRRPESPRVHLAEPGDEEIDFGAALRSLDSYPPHLREWETT